MLSLANRQLLLGVLAVSGLTTVCCLLLFVMQYGRAARVTALERRVESFESHASERASRDAGVEALVAELRQELLRSRAELADLRAAAEQGDAEPTVDLRVEIDNLERGLERLLDLERRLGVSLTATPSEARRTP